MAKITLPKNERKKAKETPRNFLIFGGTMNGKTYFSDEFPNPINLNTDGNAEMIETPSITIRNDRDKNGEIIKEQSASAKLSDAIKLLENEDHTFETVIIDVIDDIITLFEQEIIEEAGVSEIGEIGWGKGHSKHEMMVRVLVMRLKELSMKTNMNIIYISRLSEFEENDVIVKNPSLKLKFLNIINGNSDMTILCEKVGKNYIRRVTTKRKNYTLEMVDDPIVADLMKTVHGAFVKSKRTSASEQAKIIKQQEETKRSEPVKVVEETKTPIVKEPVKEDEKVEKEPTKEEMKADFIEAVKDIEPKEAPRRRRRPARI